MKNDLCHRHTNTNMVTIHRFILLTLFFALLFVSCGGKQTSDKETSSDTSESNITSSDTVEYSFDLNGDMLPDIPIYPEDTVLFSNPPLLHPLSGERRAELTEIVSRINAMTIPKEILPLTEELQSSVGISIHITNDGETQVLGFGYLENGSCSISWIHINHIYTSTQTVICRNIIIEDDELYRLIRTFVDDVHANELHY